MRGRTNWFALLSFHDQNGDVWDVSRCEFVAMERFKHCFPPKPETGVPMTSTIRSLCAAGLVLGAVFAASPGTVTAQGKRHKAQHEQKRERKVEKAVVRADRHVTRAAAARRYSYSTRNHYLCNDGSWWSMSSCAGHDGLASRQYTPRASAMAIAHANANSAVARAYANGVRSSAIARCNDGTYWHSGTRTNACYRHGGVARWL